MPVIDPIKMDTANEGQKKILEGIQAKMGKITAGMPGLPGGMKFPF